MATVWSIQYLRAIAALTVVAFHFATTSGTSFDVGAFGVDLFFVISGFIMWTLTERERSPSQFLARRLARIVPTYWVVTIVFFVVACARPWVVGLHEPPTWSQLFLSLSFAPTASYPIIAQGWTLNVEMFFYLLFAATLFLSRKIQLFVLTGALSGLAIVAVTVGTGDPRPLYLLNAQLVEFAAGLLVAELWLRKFLVSPRCAAGLIAGGLALLSFRYWVYFPALIVPYLLASSLIVLGAVSMEAAGLLPRWRWLLRVGDASYLIYLIHFPLIQLTHYIAGTLPYPVQGLMVLAGASVLGVALLPTERRLTGAARRLIGAAWHRPIATEMRSPPAKPPADRAFGKPAKSTQDI